MNHHTAKLSPSELLLNSKQLEPLAPEMADRLREIQQLDVTQFSEADVRAEVIDPIVRALGYKKQTSFSAVREKHLKVLEGDLFPDYSLLVLEEPLTRTVRSAPPARTATVPIPGFAECLRFPLRVHPIKPILSARKTGRKI